MRPSSRPLAACACCAARYQFPPFWRAASFRSGRRAGALLAPCLPVGEGLRIPGAILPMRVPGTPPRGGRPTDRVHAIRQRISGTGEVDPNAGFPVPDIRAQDTACVASRIRSRRPGRGPRPGQRRADLLRLSRFKMAEKDDGVHVTITASADASQAVDVLFSHFAPELAHQQPD
jgi:hypothetical protein